MPNSLQIPPYRAALLTGADGAPVIRSNGPDSELVMTERQWYMFWQNLAGQLNDHTQALEGLGNIVTFGNHADRPDPGPWPDGALYVEWDRGSVLYQNQGGIWVYIAGQMFGTLSPDQRPTDLGMPDAGFAFRTNVDPARAFAWSGTAWIETTPIRYGTHAERLAAPVAGLVSGMLWMETDRGSVIYQNQGGTWIYLAGTMWDTMSPDHRPTDLGVFDAGFDYRSTDPPAREFIWNQTAWVDVSTVTGAVGGAASLTHPNVVTKVGSAGQITEGGITDESAANSDRLHILASGNVGIGSVSPATRLQLLSPDAAPNTGYGALNVCGGTDAGQLRIGYSSSGDYGWIQPIHDGVAFTPLLLNGAAGNVGIGGIFTPTFKLQIASDSAGKPTTSTWSVVSDLRLKQNIEAVKDDSLGILANLNWVRFEYNGAAQMPKGQQAIGLVAQALREQMPEAVRSTKGRLAEDDAEEIDILAIDYHHVIVHSARAIQQLNERIKVLQDLVAAGKP